MLVFDVQCSASFTDPLTRLYPKLQRIDLPGAADKVASFESRIPWHVSPSKIVVSR